MKNIFQYSLLKYVHSQLLGEELNLGIIVYFPDQNKIRFLYPDNFHRLKSVYRGFPDKAIKAYLKSFSILADNLSNQKRIFKDGLLETIIRQYFLSPDASSLQFREIQTGLVYVDNTDKIAKDFYNKFFFHYESESSSIVEKHDEKYALTTLINKV